MAQNEILQGCDLESSKISVKVNFFLLSDLRHLPINTHVKIHRNLIASVSVPVEQSLTKR